MNDDSNYDILDSKSEQDEDKVEELALDADLDLNERNFNLVKNSNSFKPLNAIYQKSSMSNE